MHTPYQLFGIILPTHEQMKKAAKELQSAPLDIEHIDEFRQPMKVKDTAEADLLKMQSDALLRRIRELTAEHG